MEENVKPNSTWIMKAILNNREKVLSIQGKWEDMMIKEKFCMTDIYMKLRKNDGEVMPWRKLRRRIWGCLKMNQRNKNR